MIMMRERFATTMSASLLVLALAVQGRISLSIALVPANQSNSIGTSALYCNVTDQYDRDVFVSSQAEVDTKYASCTEIEGRINIATNYTGRFYLPNVTTITGGLYTKFIYQENSYGEYPPTPLLTSIEVPDLNDTSGIGIHAVPGLKTISFPSLTALSGSINVVGIEDCYLDFPSLTNTEYLTITGNMTRYCYISHTANIVYSF